MLPCAVITPKGTLLLFPTQNPTCFKSQLSPHLRAARALADVVPFATIFG